MNLKKTDMRTKIKKELNILNGMITEANSDIVKMIIVSAEAEMFLRKKDLSPNKAEAIENKLFRIIEEIKKSKIKKSYQEDLK